MKLIYVFILTFFTQSVFSQTLVENKVDEFTKTSVKRTSWDVICAKSGLYVYSRASKLNESRIITLRIMMGTSVFSIRKDAKLMLKLSNDSIVTLYNSEYALSCRGCGSINIVGYNNPGVSVDYFISKTDYQTLLESRVVKLRVYASDGYSEGDIKKKNSEEIYKQLKLIE